MPTVAQIHGMLLEEAVLHLLRFSGYRPVTFHGADPTLRAGSAGLEVLGRGEHHQIDAIADFTIPQPFVNPARLLVEAKFKDSAVGIEIVRNAVGVLKDVSEYWVSPPSARRGAGVPQPVQQPRFHYQYAILASSGFSENAQRFAVAHDVYLIPFERAGFFQPILAAIKACTPADGAVDRRRAVPMDLELSELRRRVRESLATGQALETAEVGDDALVAGLAAAVLAIRQVEFAVLAVALGRVPLVLTPAPGVELGELTGTIRVRIYWDDESWYLRRVGPDGRELPMFSFDVPETLLSQYIDQHELSPRRALDLKHNALSAIQALIVRDGEARLIRFVLDSEWLERVKHQLDQRR